MEMGPLPVYPDSSVAHDGDRLPAFDRIARVHPDGTQVSVQAVVTGAVPAVLDHDVFPIVRVTGHDIGVHDFSVANGTDFIERLAVSIAMQGANIDSFVKACVNDATRCVGGIAHKAVFAALPWHRFHPFVIAFHVLVKGRTGAREQSGIIRRQNKIESVISSGLSPYRD